jgi:hypothetical protein
VDTRPALLIDVDGVLNPEFRCNPPYCRCHPRWIRRRVFPDGQTYRVILNPAHGRKLLELASGTGSELVWATTWQAHANTWIAPHVRLPTMPWVPIEAPSSGEIPVSIGAWKAECVAAWGGHGRPFVWFDDEPDVADTLAEIAQKKPVGEHLVIKVNPKTGLTDDHLGEARSWLSTAGRST